MIPVFRATTPKHSFIFDVDPDGTFKEILITYGQKDTIVLEKHKSDLSFSESVLPDQTTEYTASLKLTQEETNQFSRKNGDKVAIQVRVLTTDGDVVAFDKFILDLKDVLNDEVLQ